MSDASAIACHNLFVELGGRPILRDFSLELSAGERVLLTGESGAGKSTVLRCVLGFVRPSAGEISVEGLRLDPRNVWAARRKIAWVPQEPTFLAGTVRETLLRPLGYRANHGSTADDPRLESLLARVRLPRRLLDEAVADLSGGERQRVALGAAMLLDRPIMLLDEPTSALDDESAAAVVRCLRDRPDLTLLAVAHDHALRPIADRVVTLDKLDQAGDR